MQRVWHRGSPTEYGIEVYTEGDCWILAYYLAKKLNSKVSLIGAYDWGHAVALVPPHMVNGKERYLDINGISTRHKLVNDVGYTGRGNKGVLHVEPTNTLVTYARNIWQSYDPVVFYKSYDASFDTARRTAQRLINTHLGE